MNWDGSMKRTVILSGAAVLLIVSSLSAVYATQADSVKIDPISTGSLPKKVAFENSEVIVPGMLSKVHRRDRLLVPDRL